MFGYPAMWSHLLGDRTVPFRVTPTRPTTSEGCTFWPVRRDAVAGQDRDPDRWHVSDRPSMRRAGTSVRTAALSPVTDNAGAKHSLL